MQVFSTQHSASRTGCWPEGTGLLLGMVFIQIPVLQGPFGTQLPWDTRNPHHLLLMSNSQLPDYTAHVFCSHTHQEHKM